MLFIAIPVYGGIAHVDFMMSVFNLCKELNKYEISHEIKIIQNESLISRARNGLCAMFMDNPNYTKLLFLDSDLVFSPNTILRMIQSKKPIVGAIYPKKNINWDKVKYFSNKVDTNELQIRSTDLNYNFKYYNKNKVKIENGFAEMNDIPTGCMLICKKALSMIIHKNRHTKYINNTAGYGGSNCFYDLFQTGVVDNIYLSEDYFFCKLARDCGIPLWVDTQATLIHIGRHNYIGCLGAILQDSSGERLDQDAQLLKTYD